MPKHVSELTVEELSKLGSEAAADAARESRRLGLTTYGALPDGTLYSVGPDGKKHILSKEEEQRLRESLLGKQSKRAVA